MRTLVITTFALACSVGLSACNHSSPELSHVPPTEQWTWGVYEIQNEREQMKQALTAAGVPFEVRDLGAGREEIRYLEKHRDRVSTIEIDIFGQPPPSGRNVGRDSRIERGLQERHVLYRTTNYRGQALLVWDEKYDNDVDAVLRELNPEWAAGIKQMRGQ